MPGAEAEDHFRTEVGRVELMSSDVRLILHQEGLDRVPQTGTVQPSVGALRVIETMYNIRPRLQTARVTYVTKVAPRSVSAIALVKAVQTGSLTTAVLGAATGDGNAQLRALMRVWPVLSQLLREVHPSDPTIDDSLVMMAHEAFDLGSANPARAIGAVVTSVFEALSLRYTAYLRGVGDAPTWAETLVEARKVTQRVVEITGTLGGSTETPAAIAERARVAREAKAAADAKAAAAPGAEVPAAADGGGGAAADGEPGSPGGGKKGKKK